MRELVKYHNNPEFLIIGSGIAGLSFALKAARLGKVYIVTKNAANETNTRFAQGGIACVLNKDDDLELHVEDTLKAGAGLCNEDAVRIMVNEARECIDELIKIGVLFSQSNDHLDLGLEGGHTRNRIAHVKDFTGREIENVLLSEVRRNNNITILENHMAIDLVLGDQSTDRDSHNRCLGAEILNEQTNEIQFIFANFTILCTGGAGQVYQHTTNPEIATGDGIAMAFRAGSQVKDMEFVQFHPTALYFPGSPVFLISEALRGAGAILKNISGESFMEKYHHLGSLAPRDITSRAIVNEMQISGSNHVFLDATHIPVDELISLFPNIYGSCLKLGLDITTSQIPVVPSAHFMCGGVETDINGRTNILDLYAFGEVACTGVHGANRLASNSLLEAMVFSNRAYEDIRKRIGNSSFQKSLHPLPKDQCIERYLEPDNNVVVNLLHKTRELMSRYAGIIRHFEDMKLAYREISKIENLSKNLFLRHKNSREVIELYNIALTSRLIISAALQRAKSVGAHYVADDSLSLVSTVETARFDKITVSAKSIA